MRRFPLAQRSRSPIQMYSSAVLTANSGDAEEDENENEEEIDEPEA